MASLKSPLPLTQSQLEDLRALSELFGRDIIVIGAGALAFFLDFRHRKTEDLDLSLAIAVDELGPRLGVAKGWQADARAEQRWRSPHGNDFDFIPASPEALVQGNIVWPQTKTKMNAAGLELAFAHAVPLSPAPRVRVAPPAVVCVLKMVAFLDRPLERKRDLDDFAFLLRAFAEPGDERLFDGPFAQAGLDLRHGSAFLLGLACSAILTPKTGEFVAEFLAALEDEDKWPRAHLVRAFTPFPEDSREDPAAEPLRAFRLGLVS